MPWPSPTPLHPTDPSGSAPSILATRTTLAALRDASDPCDLLVSLYRVTQAFGARASACAHVVPDPERPPRVLLLCACEAERIYTHLSTGSALDHPWLHYAREHDEPVWSSQLGSTAADFPPASQRPVLIVPTHSGGTTGRYGVRATMEPGAGPGRRPCARSIGRWCAGPDAQADGLKRRRVPCAPPSPRSARPR
jgi:hypothetical protein